jgi:hypothetical protein
MNPGAVEEAGAPKQHRPLLPRRFSSVGGAAEHLLSTPGGVARPPGVGLNAPLVDLGQPMRGLKPPLKIEHRRLNPEQLELREG